MMDDKTLEENPLYESLQLDPYGAAESFRRLATRTIDPPTAFQDPVEFQGVGIGGRRPSLPPRTSKSNYGIYRTNHSGTPTSSGLTSGGGGPTYRNYAATGTIQPPPPPINTGANPGSLTVAQLTQVFATTGPFLINRTSAPPTMDTSHAKAATAATSSPHSYLHNLIKSKSVYKLPAPLSRSQERMLDLSDGNCSSTSTPPPNLFAVPRREFPPNDSTTPKIQPQPFSTPTTTRKSKRMSNIFQTLSRSKTPSQQEKQDKADRTDPKHPENEVGIGREIPIRQGYLYKKSQKTLNKEWKKKYVTLTTDGRLTYHRHVHDYIEDIHGKDIPLKHTTVKVPALRFGTASSKASNASQSGDELSEPANGGEGKAGATNGGSVPGSATKDKSAKKRHRRHKSITGKNGFGSDDDGEFVIVSLANKQWKFEAENAEERDAWVAAIEQQIMNSLRLNEIDKCKSKPGHALDENSLRAIKSLPGNLQCVDCDASNPDWASLNIGALICMECSGIHRNLGTHISKVRSLVLDDWPASHTAVMMSLGNTTVNRIWELNTGGRSKPTPQSSREEREQWIRSKYEHKEFLCAMDTSILSLEEQLFQAIKQNDFVTVYNCLVHGAKSNQYSGDLQTAIQIAASKANLAVVQLLLWNNGDVNKLDSFGRSALFYCKGKKDIEDLLKSAGCSTQSVTTQLSTTLTTKASMYEYV